MSFDWSTWLPATCFPAGCFCERIGAGWIRQPANTWSSLLFLVPAAMALAAGRDPGPVRAIARRYAAALTIIGLGSAFFHASLSFAGQTVDVLGMYLLVTLVAVTAAERVGRVVEPTASRLYWGTNLALAVILVALPAVRRFAFAALVILAIGLEWASRGQRSRSARALFVGAVAFLSVGFLFWALDLTGTLCQPASLLQGHAFWHALAALAAALHWRSVSARGT